MRKNEKITALYERLSRDDFGKDDDQQRESNSISNQKAMLEEFAAQQGFTNIVHFTDDGISGTCFDRPGFLAMMKEVEAGNVEYLCIKDMSRMGRDYLKVGQIMEILRQRGVRLLLRIVDATIFKTSYLCRRFLGNPGIANVCNLYFWPILTESN